MDSSNADADQVLVEEISHVRKVLLNRPKQLNALNFQMISRLLELFLAYEKDCNVKLIILKGKGKALSAGGDVAAVVREINKSNWKLGAKFFQKEFILNYLMATYSKSQVSILNGIVMGGGAGASIHGRFRVATENSVFAMPETALGLFPDVGASYFLSRLPGFFGEYVGLTGSRLDGAEMLACGLATHFVPSKRLSLLEEALCKVNSNTDRVSSSSLSSSNLSSISCSLVARSSVRRCPCAVLCCSSKTRGMVEDKESAEPVVASGSDSDVSRTFLDAGTEEDLLSGIKKEVEAGRLPSNVAQAMEELYQNYRNAVFQSGNPNADEIVLSNMTLALDRIFKDVEDPFVFPPYHKAIRQPFDYYIFGQNYIRPLLDFRSSYVGNISLFDEMEERLQQGHNVVLISNHQSEADPAIIALLLEATHPHIAEKMTYVAGDRVVTDPLCKPFSMGRNLLCVYSKKHMYDVPELAEMKKRSNARSVKEMALLVRGGSQIIWIAPSGGRDRPDPITEECYPAPFDASSVDNMRRLTEHAGVPGHIYPLALLCYDIMPPPPQVEKEIGERRVISFHGAGLSVAPEISFQEIVAACGDPEESKKAYTQALYDSVVEQYNVLKCAIHGKEGLEASVPTISLSQPWNSTA